MRKTVYCAILSLALGANTAFGAVIEGVSFPEERSVSGELFELNRAALLRYRWVFKVYVAGLYLGEGVRPQAILDDAPRRLEISYLYSFRAEQFAESTSQGIAKNMGDDVARELAPKIDEFNRLYRDVKPGDRYALTYRPGAGTELSLNGQVLGSVAGADFARALFSIWFGPRPFDESLKQKLLR